MNQSVLKAIKLLDFFTEKKELSIIELSEMANMPKTTVFRLVSSLEATGLLVKVRRTSHDVKYHLGLRILELANYVKEQLEYREVALPYMKKLNEELNELVHLVLREGDEGVYVETIDSTKPIRLIVKVGRRSPLYAGSGPKVLLSSFNERELNKYLKRVKLEKLSENTIVNKNELMQEIEQIQRQGFSVSRSEHYHDTIGFSYPIYDITNHIVASLGVSIPNSDCSPKREQLILDKLKETSWNVSRELGYRGKAN